MNAYEFFFLFISFILYLDLSVPSLSYYGHLNTLLKSTINISCIVECNDPSNIKYIWYKNGERMENDSSSTISIKVDSRDMEGIYTCSVKFLFTRTEKASLHQLSINVSGIVSFLISTCIGFRFYSFILSLIGAFVLTTKSFRKLLKLS